MPAKEPQAENPRKPPEFRHAQIYAIAAYIASLGGGPAIPTGAQVVQTGADPALGEQLFVANCAQCHNFAGLPAAR